MKENYSFPFLAYYLITRSVHCVFLFLESKQWTTSLTKDRLKSLPCVQRFLQTCKVKASKEEILVCLTHWGRDKMAATFQLTFWNVFSWMKMFEFRLVSLNYVPKGPINNIPALVQIMAWRRLGNKPLSEPVMVSLQMHIQCMCLSVRLNELRAEPILDERPRWPQFQQFQMTSLMGNSSPQDSFKKR